jgi:hypothetical protein
MTGKAEDGKMVKSLHAISTTRCVVSFTLRPLFLRMKRSRADWAGTHSRSDIVEKRNFLLLCGIEPDSSAVRSMTQVCRLNEDRRVMVKLILEKYGYECTAWTLDSGQDHLQN